MAVGPAWSGGQNRQTDVGTVAEWGHGFQRHVAGTLDSPFVGLLEQQRADQAGDRGLVGKDADDVGTPLISPFSRSSGLTECSLVRWAAGKLM
jgi:hypothetical protein